MPISIIAWAAGYAANKFRDTLITKLTSVTLEDKLQKGVDVWLLKYGYEDTVSDALFSIQGDEEKTRPAKTELAAAMKASRVPSQELWFRALKEQYENVRIRIPNPADRQPLFQQDFSRVEESFQDLAASLKEICIQETAYFQASMYQMLEQLSALLNKEKTVQDVLAGLGDFLDNKRILYQPFVGESANPLKPVILSAEAIRRELSEKIIPALAHEPAAKAEVQKMLQACLNFLEHLTALPYTVREDMKKEIRRLPDKPKILIQEALYYFRTEFTEPLFWLLTKYSIAIPQNILFNTRIAEIRVPEKIYFDRFVLDTRKHLAVGGESHTGQYLRIATVGEETAVNQFIVPAGTELIFYDPVPTRVRNQPLSAQFDQEIALNGQSYRPGDKIYFDLQGNIVADWPEEESRYAYLDKRKKAREAY